MHFRLYRIIFDANLLNFEANTLFCPLLTINKLNLLNSNCKSFLSLILNTLNFYFTLLIYQGS